MSLAGLLLALVSMPASATTVGSVMRDQSAAPRMFVYRFSDATHTASKEIKDALWNSLIQEIAKTARYRVIPPEEVPAYSISPLTDVNPGDRVGRQLGANYDITGRVTRLERESPDLARVEIHVCLYDSAARELVWCATVSGRSTRQAGTILQPVLIASEKAAAMAAAKLSEYRPIEARIVCRPDGYPGIIKIDRGLSHGFQTRRLVVLLEGERRVAKAVITTATANNAEARIVEIEGDLRTGTLVRAIRDYSRPGVGTAPRAEIWAPVAGSHRRLDEYFALPPSARVGSTRQALSADFRPMGGIHTAVEQTFVWKDPSTGGYARTEDGYYRIITVTFKLASGNSIPFSESPDDVIMKVAGPFMTKGLIVD